MGVFVHSSVMTGRSDDGETEFSSLVDSARTGDARAAERLVARVGARVRAWAAHFTDDDDTADDVAQDVLISLDRRVRNFRGTSRFSTWLFAVTRNVALSKRRREQRRAELLERHATLAVAPTAEPIDPDASRLASLVLEYFDALPRRQRQIFELADILGMTPADIARELGMQQVTVRAHLFKARRTIRERMLANHERLLKEYTS
jgi:RNA polymerase sigma-70 factor (ECF subfamily)